MSRSCPVKHTVTLAVVAAVSLGLSSRTDRPGGQHSGSRAQSTGADVAVVAPVNTPSRWLIPNRFSVGSLKPTVQAKQFS